MSQSPEFNPSLEIEDTGDEHLLARIRIGRVAFPEMVAVVDVEEALQLLDDGADDIDDITQLHYLPHQLD